MSRDDPEPTHREAVPTTGETGLLAILATLIAHDVEFLLIGGLAVGHHGYPRATKDVDVVPAPDPMNVARLWSALGELGAQPSATGDFRAEELPISFTREAMLDGGNWDLATLHGRLDIMRYREGALETDRDYEQLRAGAVYADYPFGRVWVVGYEDLIDLKTLAGRDQDLADIRALREANEDTGPR